jgi:hypothetical protein
MSRPLFDRRSLRTFATAALMVAAGSWYAEAGGPLFVLNNTPILWANRVVSGGPLNSQTVTIDAQGRRNVIYHVDQGTLGPLSNAQGVRFTDRIFGEFSNVPTSAIRFVNGGPIRDPDTGQPVDVTALNFGKFVDDLHPTFQNPIIFDSDGKITGGGGVLGFFGALTFEPDFSALTEGFVVLNGAVITPPSTISTTSFLGVFQHEFGHLAGPLDHEQINGSIALLRPEAAIPAGFTNRVQTNDLFAPFTETTYPFFFGAPVGSVLAASGFPDSGYFIATLDMDTKNALSNLYPTKRYRQTTGSIEGQVVFNFGDEHGKDGDGHGKDGEEHGKADGEHGRDSGRDDGRDGILVTGINIVARRINRAPYPPPLGTQAFPTPPTLDADGVPSAPPAQAATDSLATVSSAVTGLDFGHGTYRIQGLPPGEYEVILQAILPQATGGSGIGPLQFQLTLPVIEEYFHKRGTSNVVTEFTRVKVEDGEVVRGIDFEINGLDTANPSFANEVDAHSTFATAQNLGALPARVSGTASVEDPFTVVSLGEGISDLYSFTTTAPRTVVWMSLEPRNDRDRDRDHGRDRDRDVAPTGDLDLFLVLPPATATGPVRTLRFSATETNHELVGVALAPGTYFVGVGAFEGAVRYDLRVMKDVQ